MKHKSNESDVVLDSVTAGIRSEEIDPAIIEDAAARVWARLSDERTNAAPARQVEVMASELIEGCADFQSLIPAYLRGQLSEARALLLTDHTHECIPCRKALKQGRSGQGVAPALPARFKSTPPASTNAYLTWRWGIAAALVVGFALAAMLVFQRFSDSGAARATVVEAQGPVYIVSDMESRALAVGEEIPRGEKIRTAKDAYAVVRLEDGSLVETRERSEFSVSENSEGVTVHLDRGNVIVQAAKQRERHLYVATPDSLVSVTGTIFAVNSGTKGSRVSVVEGEVHVNHAGTEHVLHPGDQATTQASLEQIPIKDEIAWSRKAEQYVRLLADLTTLRKEVDQKASQPEVRYSTRFLNLLPEGTVLYAALPNLSATLSESHKIMQERINQNPALREWWEKEQGGGRPGLDQMIGQIREFGEYLGAEIVASAEMNEKGEPDNFLVLGDLKNSEGFRPYIEQKIKAINLLSKNGHAVRIIDDPLSSAAAVPTSDGKSPGEILIWIQKDFFAVAPKLEQLQRLQQMIQSGGANSFAATPFYSRISDVYRDGAGLIVAADLEKIIARAVRDSEKSSEKATRIDAYRKLGLLDLRHFIVEQKRADGHTQSRASLTFNEGRRGITSWLAAPGPMGALEYVSPDANVATAFVVKEPTALVDDLLGFMETASPNLRQNLKEMEAKQGLNIRDDFAAPLGGEFAFAIDGPILPTPSWKMVFEVYDQARLQQTFERVVEQLNQWAAREGKAGLQWEKTDVGGRTFYALKSGDLGLEVHYAYVGGYLVAAPSRALVDRAIRYRESGYTLLRSPRFTAQLPADGNANFSAVFYHDLAALIEPLAERVAKSGSLPEEQKQALKSIGAATAPTLAYAYAQGDRIILASNTEGGPFGLSPSSLLGLPNAFAIQHVMKEAMSGKNAKP